MIQDYPMQVFVLYSLNNQIRTGMPDASRFHKARSLPSAFFRFLLLEDAFALNDVLGAFFLEKMLVPSDQRRQVRA